MNQSDLEREIEQEIYGKRLLVLMEHDGYFTQVLLTPEQFKKVSDAICIEVGEPNEENLQTCLLAWGDEKIDVSHFEGMKDFYPKELIDNLPNEP